MPPDRDAAALWDMLQAAYEVRDFARNRTREDYASDRAFKRAVERSTEIIGEAARSVSQDFRDAHQQVPWSKIVGTRHRLAHEYGSIDDDTIWRIATVHVPVLIAQLELLGLTPPQP